MIIQSGMIVKINEAASNHAGKMGKVVDVSTGECKVLLESGVAIWVPRADIDSQLVKEVLNHQQANQMLILEG
tara:strand:- start:8681 stop:8899 length:219 start_codon:yes stop_codon:yes gene_type:complete